MANYATNISVMATLRDMDNVSRVNFTPNGNVLKKKWMNRLPCWKHLSEFTFAYILMSLRMSM